MRTVTVSCPACHTEYRGMSVDQAERLLFHGCAECRQGDRAFRFQSGKRSTAALNVEVDENAPTG